MNTTTTINVKEFSKLFIQSKECSKEYLESSDILERLESMLELLPSGSGIDSGMQFLSDVSNKNKLVFSLPYHHMDENGYYDGWTNYSVVITPTFDGFKIKITGRDKNQTKDYLYDLLYSVFE